MAIMLKSADIVTACYQSLASQSYDLGWRRGGGGGLRVGAGDFVGVGVIAHLTKSPD